MQLYPLKFRPIYKQRIWGGQKLREIFCKDIPAGQRIGESWELADLPNDKSLIANGQLEGMTLREAIEKYPAEITGDKDFKPPFPLLIKILDCEDILSVQVHPDAETCRRMGRGEPKTECWYIISAKKDAVIYKGLAGGVTKERFADAIKQGGVAELLGKVSVQAGECHFLAAGTAHAIGAGLLIAEIQTPSDTTYRVFDWNRLDEDGRARQLHIEEALESIDYDATSDKLPVTTVGRLVDCDYFKIDKGHQLKAGEVLFSPGVMKVVMFLSGCGTITAKQAESVVFRAGDTVLLPAELEGVMQFGAESEYLTVTI